MDVVGTGGVHGTELSQLPSPQQGLRAPFRVSWLPPGDQRQIQGVLVVAGELDIATTPVLEDALRGAGGAVVIDCESLEFIDAAGIGALDRASQSVESIRLVNASPAIRR